MNPMQRLKWRYEVTAASRSSVEMQGPSPVTTDDSKVWEGIEWGHGEDSKRGWPLMPGGRQTQLYLFPHF